MRAGALLIAVVLAAFPPAVSAQTVMRPEREPVRVAGQEAWYKAGEPVLYRGELFYPEGPQVFFNRNVMVLAGEYRGVPVYVDPTVETGSVVLVPIGNGMMQPYKKLRAGALAGTSGSSTPSFPPATSSPLGAARAPAPRERVVTIAPSGTSKGRGIWIEYDGRAWRAAGGAVRVGPQFVPIGTFNGRTVYRGPDAGTIWIETAQGLASPWRRGPSVGRF